MVQGEEMTYYLLSIDAGYAGPGNACSLIDVTDRKHPKTVSAWFEHFDEAEPWDLRLRDATPLLRVVVEQPEYQGNRSNASRTQDLLHLDWSGGSLSAAYAARLAVPRTCLTPTQWKGREAKPLMHRRYWRTLTEAERQLFGGARTAAMIEKTCEKLALKRGKGRVDYPKSFLEHNLLDADCMGKVLCGAFQAKLERKLIWTR